MLVPRVKYSCVYGCLEYEVNDPGLENPKGIGLDAHGFEISIGSLTLVFKSRRSIQINAVGFNVDLWCLPILDNGLRVCEVPKVFG